MKKYETELGKYLTDKIFFMRKSDKEFKNSSTCPHIRRMDKIGYEKENNLNEYLEEHKDKTIFFLLTDDDSVFHPFYKENDQQFYCIRSRHIS